MDLQTQKIPPVEYQKERVYLNIGTPPQVDIPLASSRSDPPPFEIDNFFNEWNKTQPFEKMAEKASERPRASGPIDPTQIARFEQLQRKQLEDEAQKMRNAPPSTSQRRYILPDGRMGSKAELDLANEMAHERFSEQHAMPPVVQENMPSLSRPAPTRAPMREKLERQANVDRPVEPIASKTFRQAFSDARSRGDKTFSWTNPATGKSAMYHTMLARKEGGRIPAMNNPDEWLADQNESKKDAVKKKNKSAPKAERSPIVSRALMVSSRKS